MTTDWMEVVTVVAKRSAQFNNSSRHRTFQQPMLPEECGGWERNGRNEQKGCMIYARKMTDKEREEQAQMEIDIKNTKNKSRKLPPLHRLCDM